MSHFLDWLFTIRKVCYVFRYKAFKENGVKKMKSTGFRTVALLAQINPSTLSHLIVWQGCQIAYFKKKTQVYLMVIREWPKKNPLNLKKS